MKKMPERTCIVTKEKTLIPTNSNTDVTRNRQCFALKVKGDSMEPSGIVEGDTIVVSKGELPSNGDIVVALVDNEFIWVV